MRSVRVLDAAVEDIEQARDFYDGIEPGVGDYFSDSLITDLERLAMDDSSNLHGTKIYVMRNEKILGEKP